MITSDILAPISLSPHNEQTCTDWNRYLHLMKNTQFSKDPEEFMSQLSKIYKESSTAKINYRRNLHWNDICSAARNLYKAAKKLGKMDAR